MLIFIFVCVCVCMFSSDRLLVTWSIQPDLSPALCARFALIKKGCQLASVKFSMYLMYEEMCPSAGYSTWKLEELELVQSEAVQVMLTFSIYHNLDQSSPLLKLWHYHQQNPDEPYKAPLLIITIDGIDMNMQSEISATKVTPY